MAHKARRPTKRGPRSARDGETERQILDAARTVFIRRGTAGARMQEIAEEAGVNQALLHYYFRTKDRLAQSVFRDVAVRLLPSVVRVFGSDDRIEKKVEQFVHVYIDTVRESPFIPGHILAELHYHPERMTVLMSEVAGTSPAAVANAFLPRLRAQLKQGVAAGTMRPIAPEQFLVNLLALCVFPFAAKPVLRTVLDMDDAAFERFLDKRRAELPAFILNALRP
ncbi:MAG: TetR/AcrR family transcriptional regulator [Gemmatimonadota bacterium]|nr:TetR/AcrR family transcriptional regulator [Gemmatimonadota bacterium]